MKKGFDLLIVDKAYNNSIIEDFEKVLGKLPDEYKEFIANFKTGYPCFNNVEGTEVYGKFDTVSDTFIVEAFITLPEAMDKLYSLDRAFGTSGNHRKFRLLPICTSGSSYREYFLKINDGGIYFLNPNEDIDIHLELEKQKLAINIVEFIKTLVME